MDILASPVSIGGLTLKNRLVFAPTSLGMDPERALAFLTRIAQGGTGLIILGDVSVIDGGFGYSVCRPADLDFFARLLEIAHRYDARVAAQLFVSDNPPGPRSAPQGGGRPAPEEALRLRNQAVSRYITDMPVADIDFLVESFGKAAVLLRQMGFDLVQIHGDRMCGAFLSPLLNRRTDEYGDGVENRTLFLRRCIGAVRRAEPGLPVDLKLPVRQQSPHYGNGGLAADELADAIPLIEQAGPDSYHVALADHGALRDTIPDANHPYFQQEGCFLPYVDALRPHTQKPICGVGRLQTPAFIRRQLESGRIQLAALCRQLIADPDWPSKALTGEEGQLRRCLYCNADCVGGLMRREGVHCIFDRE